MKPTQEAINEYNNGNDSVKTALENIFGKQAFVPAKPKNEYEKIKSYEDACNEKGRKILSLQDFKTGIFEDMSEEDQEYYFVHHQLVNIVDAINGDNKLSWNNTKQKKWSPYYNIENGFVFVASGYNCTTASTGLGSRLSVFSEPASDYLGKTFIELIKKLYAYKQIN